MDNLPNPQAAQKCGRVLCCLHVLLVSLQAHVCRWSIVGKSGTNSFKTTNKGGATEPGLQKAQHPGNNELQQNDYFAG